jgi:hypothetical protein
MLRGMPAWVASRACTARSQRRSPSRSSS